MQKRAAFAITLALSGLSIISSCCVFLCSIHSYTTLHYTLRLSVVVRCSTISLSGSIGVSPIEFNHAAVLVLVTTLAAAYFQPAARVPPPSSSSSQSVTVHNPPAVHPQKPTPDAPGTRHQTPTPSPSITHRLVLLASLSHPNPPSHLISSHTTRNLRLHPPPPSEAPTTYLHQLPPILGILVSDLSLIHLSSPPPLRYSVFLLPAFLASIVSSFCSRVTDRRQLAANECADESRARVEIRQSREPESFAGGPPHLSFPSGSSRQISNHQSRAPFPCRLQLRVCLRLASIAALDDAKQASPTLASHFRRRERRLPPAFFACHLACNYEPAVCNSRRRRSWPRPISPGPPVCPGPATGERHAHAHAPPPGPRPASKRAPPASRPRTILARGWNQPANRRTQDAGTPPAP
ncbi:hypothetical protein EDB81DRAFT_56579 [Dactylonectria macrodidyma]|uniref:Uncharacterized protein n=1 Tax=Dactylonectria macrodidyma TaxID=307937 RepID=A0A9P9EN84_9HYPO|nr:hypothetical protein EDB81DRAFT_56579 [Dactylonectria macrodidyma]